MTDSAWLFVPPRCKTGGKTGASCKLIVLPGGCNAFLGSVPSGGDGDWARAFEHGGSSLSAPP